MGASAGRVLIIPKGNWNAETTYTGLDMVRYNGASWVCKNTCTNIVPSAENANYWQMVSRDGTDIAVDSEVSDESTNPVQNKVIKKYVDEHTPEIADMTGATSTQNGAHGLVPAPNIGDEKKALLGDGTWGSVDAIFTYKTKEEFDAAIASGEIPDGAKVIKEYDEGETPVIIGVDTAMSDESTNPVQNKVIKKYVDDKKVNIDGLTITLDEARNVIKLADTLKDKIGTALQPEVIANNQTTTEEGFVLDARQANPDIDGTIAKEVNTMAGRLSYIYNIPETLTSFASIPGGVGIHTYCVTNGEDPVTDSPYPSEKGWWNVVQFGTDGSGSLYRLTQITSQVYKTEYGFKGKDELWIRSRHDDAWSAWRRLSDLSDSLNRFALKSSKSYSTENESHTFALNSLSLFFITYGTVNEADVYLCRYWSENAKALVPLHLSSSISQTYEIKLDAPSRSVTITSKKSWIQVDVIGL